MQVATLPKYSLKISYATIEIRYSCGMAPLASPFQQKNWNVIPYFQSHQDKLLHVMF